MSGWAAAFGPGRRAAGFRLARLARLTRTTCTRLRRNLVQDPAPVERFDARSPKTTHSEREPLQR